MGCLRKKCPKNVMGREVWQDRFCVFQPSGSRAEVEDSVFSYWRSKNTTVPAAGTLLCKRMEVIAANPSNGKGRFAILMDGNRLFKFEAESDDIAIEWVKALRKAKMSERKRAADRTRGIGNKMKKIAISDGMVSTSSATATIRGKKPEGKYWKRTALNRSVSFSRHDLAKHGVGALMIKQKVKNNRQKRVHTGPARTTARLKLTETATGKFIAASLATERIEEDKNELPVD